MPKIVPKLPSKEEVEPELKEEIKAVEEEAQRDDRIIKYITFFGDSAIPEDSDLYKTVWNTAKILAEEGFAIVDGGGPGVMKAATDGAESVDGHTIAVYWEPKAASIFEGKNVTNVTDESDTYSNYMMRTLGLIERGQVYVVCQGGTGTVSEFGMVWALAKLYFGKHKPVILFGDFWPELIESFTKTLLIDDKELGVLHYASTPDEVMQLVLRFEDEVQMRTKRMYAGDESAFVISAGEYKTKRSFESSGKQYFEERRGPLVAKDTMDEFSKYVSPPAQVLDIGAGPGFDLGYLAQKFTVTGIELSKEFAEIARINNPENEIIEGDIKVIDIPKNTYKGIWARDILHHIGDSDLEHVLTKLVDALVPGGVIQIIVREGDGEGVEKETRPGYTLERFYHYFTENELVDRARKAGLDLVSLEHTQRSHKWISGLFQKPEN